MAETLHIVFPATDEGALSSMLRQITKAIDNSRGDAGGYGLGGEHGYGAEWDSLTFSMHPFCWCEGEDCPWCGGCACENGSCAWCRGEHRFAEHGALPPNEPPHRTAPNFWHKASGPRVWWYKYIGRDMDIHGDGDLALIGAECLAEIGRLSA